MGAKGEEGRTWEQAVNSLSFSRLKLTRDPNLHKRKKQCPAAGEWPGNAACHRRQMAARP